MYNIVTDHILTHNPTRNRKRNMSNAEFTAMFKLQDNEKIVIKKADKGSNTVVMNLSDYIREGERQLSNTTFYREINRNLTKRHKRIIDHILTTCLETEEITKHTFDYLPHGGLCTSVFYMLPKIHKDMNKPPGRSIVSSVDSPTEQISQLLDLILKPLIVNSKSYLEDTPDFINKILSIELDENDWFLSLDVVSLYTNIPHEGGMLSVQSILESREHRIPSTETLMKLLECVLKMNNFMFNNKHYLQVQGTAMGTRVAPTYANIYMDAFEHKHVYTYHKAPKHWFRFIDDVWSIYRGNEQDIKCFLEHLNSVDENISFTSTYSKNSVSFLDVITKKQGTRIQTDLFTKPTDSHRYLDYQSCHPKSIKDSIPFSQYLRICRNCSEWTDYVSHAIKLWQYILKCNYPQNLILESVKKVSSYDQKALLTHRIGKVRDGKSFFCITDYNPTNPNIRSIISEAWRFAERSSSTRPLIDCNIIYGHRKPKNLSDYLVRSNLPQSIKRNSFPPKCNRLLRCQHCPLIINRRYNHIVSTSTGRKYKIPRKVTCNSRNLIYCLECISCSSQYVGQTKNKLLIRVNQHKNDIKHQRDTSVARHFAKHANKFNIYVLQLMKDDNQSSRDMNENHWISRLHTISPQDSIYWTRNVDIVKAVPISNYPILLIMLRWGA